MLKKWESLSDFTKELIRRSFINYSLDTTYKTFDEWGKAHAFYVKKDGTLDARYNHCEPHYLAD